MVDKTDWKNIEHYVHYATALTEEDPRASKPLGFKGELWAPQATILYQMLRIEKYPALKNKISTTLKNNNPNTESILYFNKARIAAEFSFGKTVLCVALICESKCPRERPVKFNFPMMEDLNVNRFSISPEPSSRYHFKYDGRGVSFPLLSMKCKNVIHSTLVIAASSVISQWEECIKKFTPHLKFITIDNVGTLRKFQKVFHENKIQDIDIVLMKAGYITTNFTVEGEPKLYGTKRSLTQALYMITEGHIWGRIIIDDFDTIRLKKEDIFLPSLFTWVISATNRPSNISKMVESEINVSEFIRINTNVPILSVASDFLFDKILKLNCDEKYVKEHINTTTVKYFRIVNEGGNDVEILQDLGISDNVVEMISAGAIDTAAEYLDIKVNSIGDLIKRVLKEKTDKYKLSIVILERIERANSIASSRSGKHKIDMIDLCNIIKKEKDEEIIKDAMDRIGGENKEFELSMKTLKNWAEKEKENHGGHLERMRDNVRQGECQSCMVPIDDGESYIINCCQIIICGFCALTDNKFIKRCPNCASVVSTTKSLIYVGSDINIEKTLSNKELINQEELVTKFRDTDIEEHNIGEYDKWNNNKRFRSLIQLINNDSVNSISFDEIPPMVSGLIDGRQNIPVPDDVEHKYLIFAMYTESANQISTNLNSLNINHVILKNTRKEKNEAVRRFKSYGDDSVNIMIATSSRDCAGLHLPEVTRLILYHHHIDPHVTKQVIGRAQRVERKYSLEVIEILSQGEERRIIA